MAESVIIRADDAGGCVEANEAIEESLAAGVLKNVGVMAPGPAFDDAARRFAHRKDAAFGLHVCLNAEWTEVKWGPVVGAVFAPSLCEPEGWFTQSPNVLYDRGFSLDEAEGEIRAQLAKMREAGFVVSYLDTHMGVDWLPGLGERVRRLCTEEGLPYHADYGYLEEVPGEPRDPIGALIARVRTASRISAFVTHPGKNAGTMLRYGVPELPPGQVARERDADRALLCDPALGEALRRAGIESVRYGA